MLRYFSSSWLAIQKLGLRINYILCYTILKVLKLCANEVLKAYKDNVSIVLVTYLLIFVLSKIILCKPFEQWRYGLHSVPWVLSAAIEGIINYRWIIQRSKES